MIPRTPRHFDGTKPAQKRAGEILPTILAEIAKRANAPRDGVFQEWFFLLGEKMAALTEPISFVDGILTVKVKSATLYSLLCQCERPRLLKKLQEKFPVRNLVFRIR